MEVENQVENCIIKHSKMHFDLTALQEKKIEHGSDKGVQFNGNDYVEDALKKGASFVVTDSSRFKSTNDKNIIYVNNTIVALRKIAKNILKTTKKITGKHKPKKSTHK